MWLSTQNTIIFNCTCIFIIHLCRINPKYWYTLTPTLTSARRFIQIWIYGDLLYKFRKIVCKTDFPVQFKNTVTRYKKTGYDIDILRQTACMVVNPVMVDSFSFLFICTWSVLRLNDCSLLNLFQLVGAWLSVSLVGLIAVLFVVFLCSDFRSPFSRLLCFIRVVFDYMCSTVMFHRLDRRLLYGATYICNLELHQH